jgi:transaldolase
VKIFLDTANIKEIKEAARVGLLDGVTTNPTLISKEKRPFKELLKEICGIVKGGVVNAEVVGESVDEMVTEAQELTKISDNIVVKIPMGPVGLAAVRELIPRGIKTNVTLCFSALQAIAVAKAGATYVSIFVGRLDDVGHNGMEIVRQIKQIYQNYQFPTKIIVASIRHPLHLLESALIGVDIATVPYAVYEKMFKHPLTEQGVQTFLKDWAKVIIS